MIKRTTQNWAIGQNVKVGFLTLQVRAAIPTPGDGRPDEYILRGRKGEYYSFIPHYGLERLSTTEAMGKLEDAVETQQAFSDAQARDEARCELNREAA